jgi:hypothetical protein
LAAAAWAPVVAATTPAVASTTLIAAPAATSVRRRGRARRGGTDAMDRLFEAGGAGADA